MPSKKELLRQIERKDARIHDLEMKNRRLEDLIDSLRGEIRKTDGELCDAIKTVSATPPDCTRGEWCRACTFEKAHIVRRHDGYNARLDVIRYCGKAMACQNFVQKPFDNVKEK